jgi:sodium transport system permease protein
VRFRLVRTIYLKEITEALRDRRTLFLMVGVPILLYPMLILLLGRLQETQTAVQIARVSRVAVWGVLPGGMAASLTSKGKIELMAWGGAPGWLRGDFEAGRLTPPAIPPPGLISVDEPPPPPKIPTADWAREAQGLILGRKADAVLIAWPGFAEKVRGGGSGEAMVLFDVVRPESQKARDRVAEALRLYRINLLQAREKEAGLAGGFTRGFELVSQNIAPEKRRSGMLMGAVLPYLLIIFSAASGLYAAIDMTAGEKERGTMQTLLCAPLEPLEIITGKFLAVWTISMLATGVNLVSLTLTFSRIELVPGMVFQVTPASYILAFLVLLPVSLMVNAVFLALGAFAKDFKEGQNYLTPVLMSLFGPLLVTMIPGIELTPQLAFFPIINAALLIKGLFIGEWTAEMFFLVELSSLCFAALALLLAANVFQRNNVLLGRETLTSLLVFSRKAGDRPTPGASMLVFCVVLVLMFYASLSLLRLSLPAMLATVQIGIMLAPALLFIWAKGYDWRETLSLRPLPPLALLGSILVGASGWTIGSGVLVRLMPPPESLLKALEKILTLDERAAPFWQVFIFVALLPAICEESLFRGLLLNGFRRLGMWPAVLATAFMFGLVHASIYRILPTLFMGVLFGFVVWRTGSIFAGMICHMLNNGLMVWISRTSEAAELLGLKGVKFLPWPMVGLGALVLFTGLWLVTASTRNAAAAGEAQPSRTTR